MAALLKAGQCAGVWCAGIGFGMSHAVPVVMADGNSQGKDKGKIRPSELPIYEDPEDLYDISYHVSGKGQVQEGVEVVRQELSDVVDATKEFRQQLDHYYQTGRAHTAGELAYLREEENVVARVGAIATGGVLGLLLAARRRGFFRKLFYTSAAAGATAALLYPQHARHYTQEAAVNAGTYATVAYNFLIGVKPNGTVAPPSSASIADDSGKSASGSRGVVEVSNPYPALLTLPYTRQFRKQDAVPSQLLGHRSAGRKKTAEQITEEVSQVTTLGFRLQDRNDADDDALEGFGSVSVTVKNKCEKCGKVKVSAAKEAAADGSTVELKPELKEEASKAHKEQFVSQVAYLADKAVVVINELERGAEKIENVSEKLESVAKVVETVSETVADAAAEAAPLIGDQLEMVAEGIETDAKIAEAIFSETKHMAGKVEDVLESVKELVDTVRESVEELKVVSELVQSGKEEKHPLLNKIFSFFSTDQKTQAVSSQSDTPLVNDIVTSASEATVPQETDISVKDSHKSSLKDSHETVQVITETKIDSIPEKESPEIPTIIVTDDTGKSEINDVSVTKFSKITESEIKNIMTADKISFEEKHAELTASNSDVKLKDIPEGRSKNSPFAKLTEWFSGEKQPQPVVPRGTLAAASTAEDSIPVTGTKSDSSSVTSKNDNIKEATKTITDINANIKNKTEEALRVTVSPIATQVDTSSPEISDSNNTQEKLSSSLPPSPAAFSVTHSDQDVIVSAGPSNVVLLPPEATLPQDSLSTSLSTSQTIRDTQTATTQPPSVATTESPAVATTEPPAVATTEPAGLATTDVAIRVQHRQGLIIVEAPGTAASTLDPSQVPPPYASAATSSHSPPSESDVKAKASPAQETAEKKAAAEKDLVVKAALEAARKQGVQGDPGQSHPDDADMYTTRS